MKSSLRTKLTVTYVSIALLCVGLISILSNVLMENQFRQYIIQNQETKNENLVQSIASQYKDDGSWHSDVIQGLGINALEQGMIVKVMNHKNNTVWDAQCYNNGMCQRMIFHMSENMYSRYPNWKGEYVEKSYPIFIEGKQVGTAQIGYFGPYYFTDTDLAFINTLNMVLIGVGIISLIISFILGSVMSKRISNPIVRVINTAKMIADGYYDARCIEKSGTIEINQLTQAINNLADSLGKQENLRKRLTADVAHELRTPLATLQSHLEAMIDGIWEADTKRLDSCHEETMRLGRMVGDLEKLARYENESLILDKTEFDLSDIIRNCILNFENDFKNKNIDIHFEGEGQIIFADKDKISQVVINIMTNALKYTQPGGNVEILLSGSKEVAELIIKDNGIGISDEDIKYIFERFYRADKSRTRATGGSGIGLTIAKARVDAHRGTIEVSSKINQGTEFMIKLPK